MVSIGRFRAVIFDFDGVIVNTEGVQARAWSAVAEELGVDVKVTVGRIAGKLDRHIAPELFPGHDPVWCVWRKSRAQVEMEERAGIEYIHETLELARRIRGTHKLAICSSSRTERIAEVLGKWEGGKNFRFEISKEENAAQRAAAKRGDGNALGWFDVIVGQVTGEECKPAPGPYLKALRLLGVGAGEACAVEDSPTGIAAAKGAGIFTVQLLHEGMEVNPMADAVITSAEDIV
jgi:beta-phosphoglucomutase-like phosphatase (HAD superfamily)